MRIYEPRGDPRLAEALRRAEPPAPERPLGPLVRRIVAAAGPVLDRRRPRPSAWWEYMAVWARTLIPLGVTVAVAAGVGIVWVSVTDPILPPSPEPRALLGVVTNQVSSPELVDFALSTSRWRQSVVPGARGK
ncbi:MAG TPA: hypothetical protein VMH39_14495 [Gemmatimonadaceae bacterium]|nr:hypothetical protein [Gemmatimonadaceae bacterium]